MKLHAHRVPPRVFATQPAQLAPGPEALRVMIGSAAYYFGLGDLLREWNNLDAAERCLSQGMELVKGMLTVDAELVLQGYTTLARLELARGAASSAEAVLEAFMQLADARHFVPSLLVRAAAVQAWLALAQGNLASANRWMQACYLSPDTVDLSYPREREYLTLVRGASPRGVNHQDRWPLFHHNQ